MGTAQRVSLLFFEPEPLQVGWDMLLKNACLVKDLLFPDIRDCGLLSDDAS